MVWSLRTIPELTDQQFDEWNKLLEARVGIRVTAHQRGLLQTQLMRRIRELELEHYDEYYQQVVGGVLGRIEWSILVDRLVVKETSFFRHKDSLRFVQYLLQARINNKTLKGNFELWSLGCATGEEAYSLAMAVNDCFELAELEPRYGITATDISQSALRTARQGIYSARKVTSLNDNQRAHYFRSVDKNTCQVVDKLRQRVCFTQGNLLKVADMPIAGMDVIYCQNVLIYFRRWRRREIMNSLAARIKIGGVLVAGLGEIVDWSHPNLKRVSDERVQAYVRYR